MDWNIPYDDSREKEGGMGVEAGAKGKQGTEVQEAGKERPHHHLFHLNHFCFLAKKSPPASGKT